MLSDLLNLRKFLGFRQMIDNLKTFKAARKPIRGYMQTQALFALMETGLIEELENSSKVDLEYFARRRGLDGDILNYLCRYLTRSGFLVTEEKHVALSNKGRVFLSRTRGVFQIFLAYKPYFDHLTPLALGEVKLDDLERRDEWVAQGFRDTGRRITFRVMKAIARKKNWASMIELGCGALDLASFMAEGWPEFRALGIDHDPRFLQEAEQLRQRNQLADRVKLKLLDVFDLGPSEEYGPYQVVAAVDLFHGYFWEGEERLLEMFKAIKAAFPGKDFLVSEMVMADPAGMAGIAYPYVEHELFHDLTRQRTFGEGQLEELLQKARFQVVEAWPVRNLAARTFIHFR